MPSIPDLHEPLSDGHVALRPAAERDIPEVLIAHQDDPELHIRLGMGRPPSGAELGRYLEEEPERRASGRGITLAVLQPGSDHCRGWLNAHRFDWDHRRAELGVWLVPQARGQHFARRSLVLACRWLFDSCDLERIQVLTDPDNEPMIRAARAAGFQQEGILRSHHRERGQRVDQTIMSLLPGDLG